MGIVRWWFKRPLYIQISIGILAGVILGLLLGRDALYLKPLGDIFIRLLMMLIVPLTFFTLISGLTKLENLRSLRALGGRIIFYYAASSLIAAAVGLLMALIVRPGRDAAGLLGAGAAAAEPQHFSFLDTVVSWFPQNPLEALVQGNMLQIIIFSLIAGLGILALGEKAGRLNRLISDGADLMITITGFVMMTAPYGIMALVANMVVSLEAKMLVEVGRLILADTAAMFILLIVFYPPIIRFLGRLSPVLFYRHAAPAILVAGSTTSSGAALPVAMAVAEKNMGIEEKVWGFTLPLGATVNQNGMAAAIGVISIFAAHLYGFPITPARMFQFVFLGLVLSSGTAGVKGAGVVVSSVLLQTLNMPLTLIPILAAIWPILDIGHTICNVTGDLVGTAVVASRMKMMNPDVYNGRSAASGWQSAGSLSGNNKQ